MKNLPLLCAAALLAGLAAIGSGCAGGCGEEPKESSSSGGGGTGPSGSTMGGGQVGVKDDNKKIGGDASRSGFDAARKGESLTSKEKAGALAREGDAGKPRARGLRDVAPSELSPALNATPSSRRTLVFERKPGCEDCELAEPAVARIALDYGDDYDFYRVDLGDVHLTTSTSLPIFLMYKGGAQTSRLAGLPFKRETRVDGTIEDAASYQKRLRRWLRDALTQKNLNFAKR